MAQINATGAAYESKSNGIMFSAQSAGDFVTLVKRNKRDLICIERETMSLTAEDIDNTYDALKKINLLEETTPPLSDRGRKLNAIAEAISKKLDATPWHNSYTGQLRDIKRTVGGDQFFTNWKTRRISLLIDYAIYVNPAIFNKYRSLAVAVSNTPI